MLKLLGANIGHEPLHFAPADIRAAGFNAVRIPLRKDTAQAIADFTELAHDHGMAVIIVVAHESIRFPPAGYTFDDPEYDGDERSAYQRAADFYVPIFARPTVDVDFWQVGNESDGDPAINHESWCMEPADLNSLLGAWVPAIRARREDAFILGPGLVTGQPDYLDHINLTGLSALCPHPYAQTPETVESLLDGYRRFGLPFLLTEFGWPHPDPDRRGRYLADMVRVFEAQPDVLGACWYNLDALQLHPQPFHLMEWGQPTAALAYVQALQYPDYVRTSPDAPDGPTVPTPDPGGPMWTREQIIALSNRLADEHGIPRVAMLGCGIAESDLVWNARRPKTPAEDAAYWPDVSMGVWQQTIRWSREYVDWSWDHGHPVAELPGADVIKFIGDLYFNPEHAGRVAAPQIKHYLTQENGRVLDALCRYNWPAKPPAQNPNRANCQRGIVEAERILAAAPEPQPEPVPERLHPTIPEPALAAYWSAAVPGIPFAAQLGIVREWAKASTKYGPAVTVEVRDGASVWQGFVHGYAEWTAAGEFVWHG